jgi:hypothetical protein
LANDGSQSSQQQQQQQQAPARPDGLPDKFWDGEKNTVKVDDLVKEHLGLSQRFAKGKDAFIPELRAQLEPELRTALTKELEPNLRKTIEGERYKNRPEKPDGYKLEPVKGAENVVFLTEKPGADFKPEEGKQYFIVDNADPLMTFWREHAHANGLGNDGFMKGVLTFVQAQAAKTQASEAQLTTWRDKDREGLGEHGKARIEHVGGQLKALVGEDGLKALDFDFLPAKGIEALEAVLEKTGQPRFSPSSSGGGAEPGDTEEQLKAIQAEPDYWESPEKQARVAKGYAKLYPGKSNPALGPTTRQ